MVPDKSNKLSVFFLIPEKASEKTIQTKKIIEDNLTVYRKELMYWGGVKLSGVRTKDRIDTALKIMNAKINKGGFFNLSLNFRSPTIQNMETATSRSEILVLLKIGSLII